MRGSFRPAGPIRALRPLVRHRDVQSEHLCVLQQNLELFDMCQTQLLACDGAIDAELRRLTASVAPPTAPLPRLAVRIGKPKAITARTLAILVYRTLTGRLVYRDPGAHTYNARRRGRLVRRLRQRAATLGFTLVNRETGEVLGATVS